MGEVHQKGCDFESNREDASDRMSCIGEANLVTFIFGLQLLLKRLLSHSAIIKLKMITSGRLLLARLSSNSACRSRRTRDFWNGPHQSARMLAEPLRP